MRTSVFKKYYIVFIYIVGDYKKDLIPLIFFIIEHF